MVAPLSTDVRGSVADDGGVVVDDSASVVAVVAAVPDEVDDVPVDDEP